MEIINKAQRMLERYALCDNCLGRQFALLGYGMDNDQRGRAIKIILTMKGHQLILKDKDEGVDLLRTLASNGSFDIAINLLKKMGEKFEDKRSCFLCGNLFKKIPSIASKIIDMLKDYEYESFLVGIRLPLEIEEREDEFKAEFNIQHGESLKNELSRVIGKMIREATKKPATYKNPEITILVNPFTEEIQI